MNAVSIRQRRMWDLFVTVASYLGAITGLIVLIWILYVVVMKGVSALDWSFFTKLPAPPGMKGGGLANAIIGTVMMTALAAICAVPVGIAAGVYLSEFGKDSVYANIIRFVTNVLIGIPSIIVGVFVYGLMVLPMKSFSGYAGAVSLAVIMLPVVVRTTEDMLTMVPDALREVGLAMGFSRWRATIGVVFRAAKTGLLTGVLLAVARVSGETAPLLFTALNSPYWMESLGKPTANLTVAIFNYAMSPYEDWQAMAWGASLLIMIGVLGFTVVARILLMSRQDR